ncbi:unnamed protein product, partial [Staurois parvus]
METNRYNVSTTVNVKEVRELSEIAELSAGTLFAGCRRDENRPIGEKFLLIFGFGANRIFPNIRNEFHFVMFDSLI